MPEMDYTARDTMEEESKATPEQARTATHAPLTEEQIRAAQHGGFSFRIHSRSIISC